MCRGNGCIFAIDGLKLIYYCTHISIKKSIYIRDDDGSTLYVVLNPPYHHNIPTSKIFIFTVTHSASITNIP